MKVLAWVMLGLIAAGFTYLTLTTDNDQLAIISGLVAMFSWLLFGYFALGITIYDQTGTPHTDRYPAMAAYGLMMALPNLYVAITGPLEIIRDREGLRREVT